MNFSVKNIRTKIGILLAAFGPGLYLIGYNIGPGSVTTMSQSGARFGISLAWTLVFSCLFTYVMIMAYGRYTLITGKTALYSYRYYFHWFIGIFALVSILAGELSSSIGVMGVISEAVHEWSTFTLPTGLEISTRGAAIFFCLLMYLLYWVGRYQSFEKALALMVGTMGVCFVLSMIILNPDPMTVISGLVPKMPVGADAPLIAAGMTGTTLSPVIFIVRSIIVREKKWGPDDILKEKKDAAFSAFVMFVLSISIMACAVGTMFVRGLTVNTAIDMVHTLEPLAGRFAASLFVLGLIAAGLSSFFPIMILVPMLVCDYRGQENNIHTPLYKIIVLLCCALGLISPVFGGKPVIIIIASQAFQSLSMPIVSLLIIILFNRKSIVGKYTFSSPMNIICFATFIFSIVMAYYGVVGLLGLL